MNHEFNGRQFHIFEASASQAKDGPPDVSGALFSAAYSSPVKLNVHVSNVPEVSEPVPPGEWLQQIDAVFTAGAQAVRPVEKWLTQPNAVNDALIAIGPALDNAAEYYLKTSAKKVANDGRSIVGSAAQALYDTLGHPLSPAERARVAGSIIPMFFGAVKAEQSVCSSAVDALESDALRESELSRLGIIRLTRKAGKGGDWKVINERRAFDVVQQATKDGCVASVGEMLSHGQLTQADLLPKVGTVPERLPELLGAGWKCRTVADKDAAFAVFSRNPGSWSAELKEDFAHRVRMGHMVVVDGINRAGNVMIRDSQHATRYEMTPERFVHYWTGRAIWR